MEHTKGKWKIDGLSIYVADHFSRRLWIATVCVGMPSEDESEANARLISAAPDLLEACKAISKMPCLLKLLGEPEENCTCASCIAKAAIKKAER